MVDPVAQKASSSRSKSVSLIGVPLGWGASRFGVQHGPSALRQTRILSHIQELGYEVQDLGDIPVPRQAKASDGTMKYAGEILQVCEALCLKVSQSLQEGSLPVVLGGDHSLAMGSVSGTSKFCSQKRKSIGLLWVDAHGDINTPATTPSGNIHGMPVAHLLGLGDAAFARIGGFSPKVLPQNTCLIGIRDLDPGERKIIKEQGVHVFTMKDIDLHGAAKVFEKALTLAADGTAGVHLSFDIDAVDPSYAMGTGTPKEGGLTIREAHLFMELLADSGKCLGMDMTEVNPKMDVKNQTAQLAGELILSALGKSIL